jgi:hypothetical protein
MPNLQGKLRYPVSRFSSFCVPGLCTVGRRSAEHGTRRIWWRRFARDAEQSHTFLPAMAVYRRFSRRRVRISANHRAARRGRCVWKSTAGLTCILGEVIQALIIFTTFGASAIRVNPQKDSIVS